MDGYTFMFEGDSHNSSGSKLAVVLITALPVHVWVTWALVDPSISIEMKNGKTGKIGLQ